jgi:hypothetical protein
MEPARSPAIPRGLPDVSRCTPRRARAGVVWGVGLFLLLQLAAGIMIDRFGLSLRFAEVNGVLAKLSAGADPQVVFLGSSRFLGGVATDEIARSTGRRPETVLNAAVTAGDVIAADFVLMQLLERGARPTLVVLEVSPDTLNHRTYWLRYHLVRQLTWADVPRYVGDVIALREMGTLLLSRLLPLYYYRQAMLANAPQLPRPRHLAPGNDAAGLLSIPSLSPEQLAISRQGVTHARQMLEDFHIGGRTAEALERILSRCDSIGTKVLLVGAPVTSAFRTAYTPEIDAAYHAYLDDVVRKHGCRFLDYRDRVPSALFEDAHHLSAEGSRYFSRLLAREALPAD